MDRIQVSDPTQLVVALSAAGQIVRQVGDRVDASTALCHGGDGEGKLGLFYDRKAGRWGAHCLTGNCESVDAVHAVQAAAGVTLCRCDACFDAWRRGNGPKSPRSTPIAANKGAERPSARKSGGDRPDTADYAARLWIQAAASTGKAPAGHPVSKWLASKAPGGLWPVGEPLPASVRWLTRKQLPNGRDVDPGSCAAGALVLAMRPLGDPSETVRKLQLVTIDAAGGKAKHWQGGDKRTYGPDRSAVGLLSRDPAWRHDPRSLTLHVVEGLADGLRVLRYAGECDLVAVCTGTGGYRALDGWHEWFARVEIWPDADAAGLDAAQLAGQRWADLGLEVTIKRLAAGHDPASAPLRKEG